MLRYQIDKSARLKREQKKINQFQLRLYKIFLESFFLDWLFNEQI